MAVDRTRLPAVTTALPFSPPTFTQIRLPDGPRVWTLTHRRAPVLAFRLIIPVGAADDPPGQTGLAALTAALLDEGTESSSAVELHETLMRLGAHLAVHTSSDATIVSLTTLPKHAARALGLMIEVASHPRFAADDCERVRDLRLTHLQQMRRLPSAVASRVFLASVYPHHPYGHVALGTDGDLRGLGADDVVGFHRRWYGAADWTLIAVGDLPDHALQDLSTSALEVAPRRALQVARLSRPDAPPPACRLFFVSRPTAVQSEIRLGHVMPPRATADYHALIVLNMVLGGQFVSRMNLNLREDKGYTYGARTSIDWRVGPSAFSFQSSIQTDATVGAIGEAMREIRDIGADRPVTDHELGLARAALVLGFPRSFETASQLARGGLALALHGLAVDEMARFVDAVNAVDSAALAQVASSHVNADGLAVVVVGASDSVLSPLEDLGLGAPTVME